MRRWDGLLDKYLSEMRACGLAESTILMRCQELDRWGNWLKHRRPRLLLEKIDTDHIVAHIRQRSVFHTRVTVASTVSICAGWGSSWYVKKSGRAGNDVYRPVADVTECG